jgi:P pilus assembly chaperone PapD
MRRVFLRNDCSVGLGLALFLLAQAVWALGLGVSPSRFEVVIEPGSVQRHNINVGNFDRDSHLYLTLSLADWGLDENGKLVLSAPGSTPQSSAEWARFSPAELNLKPGEVKQVSVEFQVPATLSSPKGFQDYRMALVVDTHLPPKEIREKIEKEQGGKGIWSKYQVTSLFYLTLAPAKAELEIQSGKLVWQQEKPLLELVLRNKGDTHARLKGELQLQDAAGNIAHKQAVENVVILEQQTQTAPLGLGDLDKLPPGEYTIHLKADKPALETAPEYQPPVLQLPLKPKK